MERIHDGIYVGHDLFTLDEIKKFTNFVSTGPTNCKFFNGDFKNGKVLLPEIANLIGKRVLDNGFKQIVENVTFCDTLYFSEIKTDQSFVIHTDTGQYFDKKANLCSRYTVLLYLNDNFSGGHTNFYTNDFKKTVSIIPKKNKVLIFDISLFHSGENVFGGTKKWIGTELIGSFK
jgi:hypothetical protein